MLSYRLAGLSVESEIALPGLIDSVADCGPPEVRIRCGAVPEKLDDAGAFGPTWAMQGGRFLLRIPDIARFLLTDGREIVFETENGTSPEDAAVFLVGTVFGILLHQRRKIVLHASAVRVGDKAVLFCGRSGAGKSTMAAALDRRGYSLLNDDVCAIGLDRAGAPIAHSDGRRLKLWAQAIEHLELADRRGSPVRSRLQKFYVEPQDSFAHALPLGAVYGLRETRAPLQDGIERPNVVDSALVIRRSAYRPRMVDAMQQNSPYFQSAANIAARAGVFYLTRPLDFAKIPDVIGRLEAHWREIGLLEAIR